MSNRKWLLLIIVLFALLTLVFFRHTLFVSEDALATRHLATDLYEYFLNASEDIEWLKQGFVPLGDYWLDRGGGLPAVPLEQLLVPSNLLLMAIYAVTGSFTASLRIIMPLFYFATLITAYWYGTIILRRRGASIVLAVACAFSMYGIIHMDHIDLTGVQPFVLLTLIFLEKVLASPERPKYMILTSVFLFMVYITQLYPFYFTAIFIGFRLAFHLMTTPQRLEAVRSTLKVGTLFLLLAVPFLLTQLLSIPSQGVKWILQIVLPALSQPPSLFLIRTTADVLIPEVAGPYYLGLSVIVLLLIPIILRRADRMYVFYLLTALFFMLYATGSYSPLNIAGWTQEHVPLSFFLKAVGRAMIIGHIGLAVCAAIGFTLLVDRLKPYIPRLLFLLVIVALVFCDLTIGYEPPTKSWAPTQNSSYAFLREQPGDFRVVEIPSTYPEMCTSSILSGHSVISEYAWGHGYFEPQYAFIKVCTKHVQQEVTAQEAAFYGIKYVSLIFSPDYHEAFYQTLKHYNNPGLEQTQEISNYFSSTEGYKLVYEDDDCTIYENLLYRGTVFSDGATVQYERTDPNTIVMEVEAEEPTSIIVSQGYTEGWVATMEDGRNLPVQELNSVQRLEVPAGNYHIVLHYQRYESSLLAGLAFYIALLIVILSLWRRKALLILPAYGIGLIVFSLVYYPYISSIYQTALTCLGTLLIVGAGSTFALRRKR